MSRESDEAPNATGGAAASEGGATGAGSGSVPPTAPLRPSARLEALGWIGMVMLLAAYAAVSFDLVARDGVPYVAVNVVGAALVGVICAAKRAWPAFALEAAWILLTIPALWSGAA